MANYDSKEHQESIRERHRQEQASAEAFAGAAEASARNEEQIRHRLDEIMEELQGINGELGAVREDMSRPSGAPRAPRPGSLEAALADGLVKKAKVPKLRAEAAARGAANAIRKFMQDNDSRASERDVIDAVREIPAKDVTDAGSYADAVHRAVADVVLEPGRGLPHDMRALDEARQLLADAGREPSRARPGDARGTSDSVLDQTLSSPPPAIASSEIIRDVSHLTTLLLGSSPAFAEAMRVQSDAIAYSLAALNKVGDMQRQDALGLAITAHAAAAQIDRR
jgi:Killing trait